MGCLFLNDHNRRLSRITVIKSGSVGAPTRMNSYVGVSCHIYGAKSYSFFNTLDLQAFCTYEKNALRLFIRPN